jgi:hypothetical protein
MVYHDIRDEYNNHVHIPMSLLFIGHYYGYELQFEEINLPNTIEYCTVNMSYAISITD